MYFLGQGVKKDERKAAKWFHIAAESNYPLAQHTLGVMYENGKGVNKDRRKALKWYRMAADRGYVDAKSALNKLEKQKTKD
jgi:TPR repeat protein